MARIMGVLSGALLAGWMVVTPTGPATAAPAPAASPLIAIVDGVIGGTLNFTGTGKQKWTFKFISSSRGGKLTLGTATTGQPVSDQSFTILPYASWLDGVPSRGHETFVVRATPAEKSAAAKPIDIEISVDLDAMAPGDTPVAFTYNVVGYAGTRISTNFFPASGLAAGQTGPLVLQAPGLGAPGNTDPAQDFDAEALAPGTATWRDANYNVITWDPRGSYASGGVFQLNDPFIDGVDVKAIVDWAADNTPTILNGAGDPAVGMSGGSSGGELQLVVAGTNPKIDAIAPSTTWHSLIDSLQPNGVLDTTAAAKLLAAISKPQIKVNPALQAGLKSGIASGRLSDATLMMLANKNAGPLLNQLQAPTLLLQGISDALFPLNQSMDTAEDILANPYGTPMKMVWFDGAALSAEVKQTLSTYTVAWLDKYVQGVPIPDAFTPNFQWWDQVGTRFTSSLYPFSPGFNSPDPISASSQGGSVPVSSSCSRPASGRTVRVTIPEGAQIAGVPSLALGYRGTGKAQALCVRVTDAATGKVLGARTNVLPITLDGKTYNAAFPLAGVTFTGQASSELTVTMWVAAAASGKPASVRVTGTNIQVAFPPRGPI